MRAFHARKLSPACIYKSTRLQSPRASEQIVWMFQLLLQLFMILHLFAAQCVLSQWLVARWHLMHGRYPRARSFDFGWGGQRSKSQALNSQHLNLQNLQSIEFDPSFEAERLKVDDLRELI